MSKDLPGTNFPLNNIVSVGGGGGCWSLKETQVSEHGKNEGMTMGCQKQIINFKNNSIE